MSDEDIIDLENVIAHTMLNPNNYFWSVNNPYD